MIQVSEVSKSYPIGKNDLFTAVNGVSLLLEEGMVTVLKGPSGSGKTTLLTLIGCMARPSSGRIRLKAAWAMPGASTAEESMDISSLPERFLTEIRRHSFGFIFQQFNLVRGLTVEENIMLPVYPSGMEQRKFRQRALVLMDRFAISRHRLSKVDWLSGGEMQRVAIARAMINDPPVIIADEPTAHLDTALSGEFMKTVAGLKEEGKTVIIASHDPLVWDSLTVDRIVEMRDGRIASSAS